MCETRATIEASLAKLVTELDPELLRGVDAKELVGYFSRLERLAGAGKALCALRVSRTGVFELDGHRHAGEWLAAETGEQLSFVPEQLTGHGDRDRAVRDRRRRRTAPDARRRAPPRRGGLTAEPDRRPRAVELDRRRLSPGRPGAGASASRRRAGDHAAAPPPTPNSPAPRCPTDLPRREPLRRPVRPRS